MTNEKLSFVYFGSGPVAAESLRQLSEHFCIEAIITKPSTEQEMRVASPNSPLHCVASRAELDQLFESHSFKSRVGVLIDFGIIVSKKVIDSFEKGIVNSHFSLLPQWRGADPITFSILSGQKQTGVSLMLLVEGMDEGPLISVGMYDFKGDETTPQLTEYLIKLSTALLRDSLERYVLGKIPVAEQTEVAKSLGYSDEPSYSRKLTKEDGRIDWTKPAYVLEREIRAYAGWPKSYTQLGSIDVVITKAHSTPDTIKGEHTGGMEYIKETALLRVTCGSGNLMIEELKPAGKRAMNTEAFMAGYKTKLGL